MSESSGAEQVTLAEAAEELGVHYMTAYRYVRTGRMLAEKRGGKWWVAPADLAAVVAEGTGARRKPTAVADPGQPRELLVEPFTARLVAGDTAACWDIISDALAAGATPSEVHQRLIGEAMRRVGLGWERGDLAVADEHRATATATRLIGQMGPLFRKRGRRRGTVVLGAFSNDPHALPSAMLADLLCDRHFSVVDLGAHTPAESFIEVALDHDDLIGLGMVTLLAECVDGAVEDTARIRAELPDALLVVGGGAVIAASERFEPIVDVVAGDGAAACDAFDATATERAKSVGAATAAAAAASADEG